MKTEFKSKFLQHILRKKKEDQGFTLIELLVVIIIIGILSAIALPSFLNQANKAKQSEAKTNVGSMNRAQQALLTQRGAFAKAEEFAQLGLGIRTQSANYIFDIDGGGRDATTGKPLTTTVTNQGQPRNQVLKAYVGGVMLTNIQGTGESATLSILCEGEKAPVAGQGGPDGNQAANFATAGDPKCPTGYVDESK